MLNQTSGREQTVSVICLILIGLSFSYDGYLIWFLHKTNKALEIQVAQLEESVNLFQKNLFRVRDEKNHIAQDLNLEKANNDFFQGQIVNITSTVNTLQKLSQTDTELLEKYSRVYFLNENYIPEKLSPIPEQYLNIPTKPLQIHSKVLPRLEAMLDGAKMDGVVIQAFSAYRSFGEQSSLKSAYTVTYGAGTANKFSADQGYSEHQLGTTLDLTTPKIGAVLSGFDKTTAYTWLQNNAYKYGFILSYPKGNTYYIFEPWHWRFVGVALATDLHNQNQYFYNIDQREVNQYLVNIFD